MDEGSISQHITVLCACQMSIIPALKCFLDMRQRVLSFILVF